MRKCLLLFILAACSQVGIAQFTNNFTDGNFTKNPFWERTSENDAQLKKDIYIVFMIVFSEDEEVESYKEFVVLHN